MSEVKRYDLVDVSKNGEHWSEIRETKHGNFIHLTDYQAAQAKIKELEGSVATIPYDEMNQNMLRLYKEAVPRLNDIIDKQKARIEKLEQSNKTMREALEIMSSKRAMTIFIEDENHVANFFKVADEALNQVKEILGE